MTGLLNGLATLTRIRLPVVANGPDAIRMAVAAVFTGTDAVPILSKGIGKNLSLWTHLSP